MNGRQDRDENISNIRIVSVESLAPEVTGYKDHGPEDKCIRIVSIESLAAAGDGNRIRVTSIETLHVFESIQVERKKEEEEIDENTFVVETLRSED